MMTGAGQNYHEDFKPESNPCKVYQTFSKQPLRLETGALVFCNREMHVEYHAPDCGHYRVWVSEENR